MTTIIESEEMFITIDGEQFDIDNIYNGGCLPSVDCGQEFYLAEDHDEAGKAARQYWQDMAENDPAEFRCMVGDDNLIGWALGEYAGPGTTKVKSLNDWLDLWLDIPEEKLAGYDGEERNVDSVSSALVDDLGFMPTVAYRNN